MSKRLTIGERVIGNNQPCLIVAELGVNHDGDPAKAAALIEAAAACGADAVKLQRRHIDSLLTQQALAAPYINPRSFGRTYGQHRRALELPDAAWPMLQALAGKRGVLFFATAYDLLSVAALHELGVPAIKVASCDASNPPLLDAVSRLGVPIILSTGMHTEAEIDYAVRRLWRHSTDLVLMHCVSSYPADVRDLNLRYLHTLAKRYNALVGWSGHDTGIATSVAAVTLGACIIERHLTASRTARGPDHAASLDPEAFARLVREIREIERALVVHPKRVLLSELPLRHRLAKSLVTTRRIHVGDVLERSMVCCKSPGDGISPLVLDSLLGKRAAVTIPADIVLTPEMLTDGG